MTPTAGDATLILVWGARTWDGRANSGFPLGIGVFADRCEDNEDLRCHCEARNLNKNLKWVEFYYFCFLGGIDEGIMSIIKVIPARTLCVPHNPHTPLLGRVWIFKSETYILQYSSSTEFLKPIKWDYFLAIQLPCMSLPSLRIKLGFSLAENILTMFGKMKEPRTSRRLTRHTSKQRRLVRLTLVVEYYVWTGAEFRMVKDFSLWEEGVWKQPLNLILIWISSITSSQWMPSTRFCTLIPLWFRFLIPSIYNSPC